MSNKSGKIVPGFRLLIAKTEPGSHFKQVLLADFSVSLRGLLRGLASRCFQLA
jgi:hypothetical protein